METLLLTLSCLWFGAATFTILAAIDLWMSFRQKRERRSRPRRYSYDQRVIERIRP